MVQLQLGFCKLSTDAIIPSKAHEDDLGYDLHALRPVTLRPGEVTKVPTGIAAQFPGWLGGLIRDRSGVATKKGVFVVAGVIDPQYTGEIIVAFQNPTDEPVHFEAGDRIAQMVLMPVIPVEVVEITDDMLQETLRGAKGFGSTGQ
jgi:dUTP pyrophosphatase